MLLAFSSLTARLGQPSNSLGFGKTINTFAQGNDSRLISIYGVTGAAGDGVTDDSAKIAAACPTGGELWLTRSTNYYIGTSTTFNCSIRFVSGAVFTKPAGVTVTINGTVYAPAVPIFFGAGSVVLGPANNDVPVEWFNAFGDWNGTTGTDNAAAFNAATAAISSGHVVMQAKAYAVGSTVNINKSNVGLRGVQGGYQFLPTLSSSSIIVNTSASADTVDVNGTQAAQFLWNDFRNFSLQRSVVPSGTASGLSLNYDGGYTVDNVQSHDSMRDFYYHNAPNNGVGATRNANAGWGNAGVTAYTSSQTLCGFCLDSTDGHPEYTISLQGIGASTGVTTPTTIGILQSGAAINDTDVDFSNFANLTDCVDVIFTGGTANAGASSDVHYHNTTCDAFRRRGIYVSGLTSATLGSIDFDNTWATSITAGTQNSFEIENSSGVAITGGEVINSAGSGIYANGSSHLKISGMHFMRTTGNMLVLNNTQSSAITGNIFEGTSGYTTGTMLGFTSGSKLNAITGNTFSGYASNGITFDSTSTNNGIVTGSNTVDSSNITTPTTDQGSNFTSAGSGGTTTAAASCPVTGVPTLAAGPAAGTGATLSFANTFPQSNCNFTVSLATGTSPAAPGSSSNAFVATWNNSAGAATAMPNRLGCVAESVSQTTAPIGHWSDGNTGIFVMYTTTQLAASTSYAWTVRCNVN